MIFTKSKINYTFTPKIMSRPIERFLGFLVDEKLNWAAHITALKAKMAR